MREEERKPSRARESGSWQGTLGKLTLDQGEVLVKVMPRRPRERRLMMVWEAFWMLVCLEAEVKPTMRLPASVHWA